MENIFSAALRLWKTPEFKRVWDDVLRLSGVNSMFWVLAQAMGAVMLILQDSLMEDLGDLLAVFYNIGLALLFSMMMFLCAYLGMGSGAAVWREMFGFVILYLAMGAAYLEYPSNELSLHALPGYLTGLGAYLFFAVNPELLVHSRLVGLYRALDALAESWVGWVFFGFIVFEIAWNSFRRGMRRLFYPIIWLSWRLGLGKPPIRIRERDD